MALLQVLKDGKLYDLSVEIDSNGKALLKGVMSLSGSNATQAVAITPNDATTISPTKGIYLGVSGDVKMDLEKGSTVTFKGLTAGVIHPISAVKVYSTGTTALEIVGVY